MPWLVRHRVSVYKTQAVRRVPNLAWMFVDSGNLWILEMELNNQVFRADPNEIESISVLKDASAAIYGVKAGNGVV